MEKRKREAEEYNIKSLVNGARVLRELSKHAVPVSLGWLAEDLSISTDRVFRILQTFCSLGFVIKEDEGYLLGHRIGELLLNHRQALKTEKRNIERRLTVEQ